MDFFYDRQIESYLLQFMRIFSDIKFELDPDENGVRVQKRVPIQYGDMSRMVGHIIKDNNQNTILPSPSMAVTITELKMNDTRRADPQYVHPMSATERYYNESTKEYEDKPGNKYTVYRYMPSPYDITFTLDILTPNTQTKLQILEQILTIFNPGLQLQHNDSVFDWTSIFEIRLKDTKWSNRSIPVGTDSKDDVCTLTFECQIWISPPAKLKRQRIIEKIMTNYYDGDPKNSQSIDDVINSPLLLRIIVSSTNHTIDVSINDDNNVEVQLLNKYGGYDPNITWPNLLKTFGTIVEGTSTLRLKLDDNLESEIDDVFGYIYHHPSDDSKLIFQVDEDTLPESTILPITRIINTAFMSPSNGLPPASIGQRYLLVSDYTNGEETAITTSISWGNIEAYENDIIEYNGTGWVVSYDSLNSTTPQYVKNSADDQHYKFTGNNWIYTYLGKYNIGYWSLENLAPL